MKIIQTGSGKTGFGIKLKMFTLKDAQSGMVRDRQWLQNTADLSLLFDDIL